MKNTHWAHVDCAVNGGYRERARGTSAKFPGTCGLCQKTFDKGEPITYVERANKKAESDPDWDVVMKEEPMTIPEVQFNEPAVNAPAIRDAEVLEEHNNGKTTGSGESTLVHALTEALLPGVNGRLSAVEQAVKTLSSQERKPNTIVLTEVTGTKVDVGLTHEAFETVLRWVNLGWHCWLVGPTGSGKTTLAEQVAKSLGREFYYSGALWDSVGLSGYKDVTGNYVPSLFRKAYENGGLFLLDEVDACDPSVLLWLNGALANGVCAFPDAMVRRHEKFICLCAANTYGQGATHEYVGRLKQDNAFLNRFRKITVDYDAKLEQALANNDKWLHRVRFVRERVKARGLKVVISPRNTLAGSVALANGVPWATVEQECLADEMTKEQWENVK